MASKPMQEEVLMIAQLEEYLQNKRLILTKALTKPRYGVEVKSIVTTSPQEVKRTIDESLELLVLKPSVS